METAWQFISKGGITMIPLGLCSLIGLAVIIDRIFYLRRNAILIPEVVAVVESIASPKGITLIIAVCEKNNGPLPNIIQAVLKNRHLPNKELKEWIVEHGRQEIRPMQHGLVILETVAAISPLLGLFGTVVGILKTFQVISQTGIGQATALSGGISEALITTIAGFGDCDSCCGRL